MGFFSNYVIYREKEAKNDTLKSILHEHFPVVVMFGLEHTVWTSPHAPEIYDNKRPQRTPILQSAPASRQDKVTPLLLTSYCFLLVMKILQLP